MIHYTHMLRNHDYSRKILKILSGRKILSFYDIADGLLKKDDSEVINNTKKARYALNRSLKGLIDSGVVEHHFSGQNNYARLTDSGRKKITTLQLESETSLLPNWDGKWRIILIDLPESRKNERDALRYLLKKAGFILLKNSAWVSPFPYEHLFMNIKKDLELTTEIMIITSSELDMDR